MADGPPAPLLPPNFASRRLTAAEMAAGGPVMHARAGARALGAGALLWGVDARHLSLAVVFEPEVPLAQARVAFYAGMAALAQAVAAAGAPERAVTIGWPDVLCYDGARLGGGMLFQPEEAAEAEVPDWLVFGADLIAARPDLAAPGACPDSTSLAEEEIGPVEAIVESFARNLLRNVDTWTALGLATFAPAYLDRLAEEGACSLAPDGALVMRPAGGATVRLALMRALGPRDWFDPDRGGPRL